MAYTEDELAEERHLKNQMLRIGKWYSLHWKEMSREELYKFDEQIRVIDRRRRKLADISIQREQEKQNEGYKKVSLC